MICSPLERGGSEDAFCSLRRVLSDASRYIKRRDRSSANTMVASIVLSNQFGIDTRSYRTMVVSPNNRAPK